MELVKPNHSEKYKLYPDKRECSHCRKIKANSCYSFYYSWRASICKECKSKMAMEKYRLKNPTVLGVSGNRKYE